MKRFFLIKKILYHHINKKNAQTNPLKTKNPTYYIHKIRNLTQEILILLHYITKLMKKKAQSNPLKNQEPKFTLPLNSKLNTKSYQTNWGKKNMKMKTRK